ncbi:unnamed protein product [Haemonchus placei]|uniref:DUF4440 domain-containing protein n=1 Tax=Haemonchus placei TaxID=6290 RepID=A0A0N4WNW2_HAEPC|nr:unnamed protein product [Haemonchus placei]
MDFTICRSFFRNGNVAKTYGDHSASPSTAGAEATLKPLYKKFEEACEKDDTQIAIGLYHPQAVIVKKDVHALYGDAIGNSYRTIWAKIGRHTFELSNQKYQGTDDYKITDFDFELKKWGSNESILKGKMLHIWKREGDKWLIYHEQYEVSQ